ncbi:MAG: hypothetical protein KDA53_06905 [Hyphomonas sp.]|nr:hypothetical protein [Hyphomonas sp.]
MRAFLALWTASLLISLIASAQGTIQGVNGDWVVYKASNEEVRPCQAISVAHPNDRPASDALSLEVVVSFNEYEEDIAIKPSEGHAFRINEIGTIQIGPSQWPLFVPTSGSAKLYGEHIEQVRDALAKGSSGTISLSIEGTGEVTFDLSLRGSSKSMRSAASLCNAPPPKLQTSAIAPQSVEPASIEVDGAQQCLKLGPASRGVAHIENSCDVPVTFSWSDTEGYCVQDDARRKLTCSTVIPARETKPVKVYTQLTYWAACREGSYVQAETGLCLQHSGVALGIAENELSDMTLRYLDSGGPYPRLQPGEMKCLKKPVHSGSFTKLQNTCGFDISVAWKDEHYCKPVGDDQGFKCLAWVVAMGETQAIRFTGKAQWAVCHYPDHPKLTGEKTFECRQLVSGSGESSEVRAQLSETEILRRQQQTEYRKQEQAKSQQRQSQTDALFAACRRELEWCLERTSRIDIFDPARNRARDQCEEGYRTCTDRALDQQSYSFADSVSVTPSRTPNSGGLPPISQQLNELQEQAKRSYEEALANERNQSNTNQDEEICGHYEGDLYFSCGVR